MLNLKDSEEQLQYFARKINKILHLIKDEEKRIELERFAQNALDDAIDVTIYALTENTLSEYEKLQRK